MDESGVKGSTLITRLKTVCEKIKSLAVNRLYLWFTEAALWCSSSRASCFHYRTQMHDSENLKLKFWYDSAKQCGSFWGKCLDSITMHKSTKNTDHLKLSSPVIEVVLKKGKVQTLYLYSCVTLYQPGLSSIWNMLPDTGQDNGTQMKYYEDGWHRRQSNQRGGKHTGGSNKLPGKTEQWRLKIKQEVLRHQIRNNFFFFFINVFVDFALRIHLSMDFNKAECSKMNVKQAKPKNQTQTG